MLTFENVSVKIGGKQLLDSVSCKIRPNSLTVLIGKNGSGKSTLLKCVNQQIEYSGKIFMDNTELSNLSPKERAKKTAILPQTFLVPHITAEEMVSLGRNPYLDFTGRLTENDRKFIKQALCDAKTEEFSPRYVDTLSGGERQRVALAMILAQNTPLCLLDEPTSYLDQMSEKAFFELLSDLKNTKSKTVLAVVHNLTTAVEYADDVWVLDCGRLVFSGTKQEFLDNNVAENVFGLNRYEAPTANGNKIFFA